MKTSFEYYIFRDAVGFNTSLVYQITSKLNVLRQSGQPVFISSKEIPAFMVALENAGYTCETMMRALMQPCSTMVKQCYWLGRTVPCEQLFHVSKSSEGFCCSFNYKHIEDNKYIVFFS